MIAHLRGRLLSKLPHQAIVEAAGVGYDVAISVSTFTALPVENAEVALHIHTQVREDTLALFGFLMLDEKRIFERLITVSGVGPKLAITILSGLSTERLVTAIRGQDHAILVKVPGVGKKLAERLVPIGQAMRAAVDKLEDMAVVAPAMRAAGPAADDVLSALVNLGYSRPAAQKAIETAVAKDKSAGEDFEHLFRGALAAIR